MREKTLEYHFWGQATVSVFWAHRPFLAGVSEEVGLINKMASCDQFPTRNLVVQSNRQDEMDPTYKQVTEFMPRETLKQKTQVSYPDSWPTDK